ncbi:MAG: bifunctional phosphopantothenoylcysteine decarboxylase/phosphopantothenate--cysteine ligase CoaBC [bacterium]|nr:bifunctional phosphopantothenoylcysteine decarboxylase/phosphopantothenate--cysteine ligase CoaBC [Gammaproteobacteria bacterium]HIL95413.1 bifunctional phosphopantothenoylcysteine decarboxylase/phosphopantothenate--cysteine ligase CoaBC [Pseudomonadales bacterium]
MPASKTKCLSNKRILLGITGGIAAYKAAELLRRLQDQGADVRVVMTPAATEFITTLTMQALSGHPVHVDILDTETESVMGHIELARWADVVLIAPASANFIARYCGGHGDDLLTTLCLAAECKIVIAPAMNQAMWQNEQTQINIQYLQQSAVHLFGPEEGLQACGEVGQGRLLDVDAIVEQMTALFPSTKLTGRKVLITAGPTREAIDPVRYISNHSSGKQGYALAEAALEAGAEVVLISGPTNLLPPERVKTINVVSADDMFSAAMAEIEDCDIFIGVAAVADFKPMIVSDQKIKKTTASSNQVMSIELVQNPDIIASVSKSQPELFTVGFAAETENLLRYAKSKLEKKNLDMIVANDVSDGAIGFDSNDNATTILWKDGQLTLPLMSKQNVSARIIDIIAERLNQPATQE